MIRNPKHRYGSWNLEKGIVLSPDRDFDHDIWVEHLSERSARAAAWRKKQREKRKRRRDQDETDH